MEVRISGLIPETITDGKGLRYSVYTQGCPHKCVNCHNPQTHPFDGGELINLDNLCKQICENPLLSGVTFSGGEPFCQAKALAVLGQLLKNTRNDFNIVTYQVILLNIWLTMQRLKIVIWIYSKSQTGSLTVNMKNICVTCFCRSEGVIIKGL